MIVLLGVVAYVLVAGFCWSLCRVSANADRMRKEG